MPRNENLRVYDFSGGLNQIAQDFFLEPNETPSCRNVIFSQMGAIIKRTGYERIISEEIDSNPITGLYLLHLSDGSRHMIATSGEDIYEVDEANETVTSLKTGLYSGADFTFTTWRDNLYMANGEDPLQVFDGANVTVNTNAPIGKYVTDHQNRLFIAGDSDNPSRLYYSELNDPNTWEHEGITNFIDIQTDDGDWITGLARQMGTLVIFKQNSIWILHGEGPQNFVLKQIQPNIGCIAPKSIVNIYNRLHFLYRDGIYSFDGGNVKLLSEKVDPTIKRISNPTLACGGWYAHHYLLCFPQDGATYNNRVLVYDIIHEAWSYFTGMDVSMFNNFDGDQDGAVGIGELYFGDSQTGLIYRYDRGNSDDGEDIDMRYSTKYFNMGAPEIVKTFRKMLFDILTIGSIQLDYDIDRGSKTGSFGIQGYEAEEEGLWGAVTWEELIWTKPDVTTFGKSLPGGNYGSNIRFNMRDRSTDPVKILGFTMQFRARRRRFVR